VAGASRDNDVSSTRPEDFLSTVRTTAARPGQVLDVVVLSADANLLETLRSAAGSEHALWEASSANAAVDHLIGGRCDILIVDLSAVGGDVGALIERLHAQFPELIFMATGRREEEGAVASLLTTGRIYRFLHKPVSPGRAYQFLNAATRRYNELRDLQPAALQAVRTITRKRPYLGKVAAATVGIVAAAIAFVLWRSQEQGLPATLQPTRAGDTPVEDVIKAKLASAQIAYLAGRLIDPRGDNALEYYRNVLALQPDNAEAKAGAQKVIDTLEQRVVKALEERSAPRVVTAWTALQRAAPDHPHLDALRQQLLALSRTQPRPTNSVATTNTRPRADTRTEQVADNTSRASAQSAEDNARGARAAVTPSGEFIDDDQAERELAEAIARELAEQEAAANGQPSEQVAEEPVPQGPTLEEEITAVAKLRERGALISPPGNNAFESIMALQQRHPDAELVRSEQQRLAFTLLDRSRTALAAKDIDEAATLIDHANTLIPGMQAVRTLQEQLAQARAQREFETNIVQAASLKRIREVPPVYPREAQRAGIEGWVQVEFTIAPDGTTRDLRVRDSNPPQIFDKAALDSVSKWRFEPIRRNGEPVAQRAALQVRFVLND
jgi:TonB family protein